MRVHDGGVRCNRSSEHIVGVGEVDNDYLILFVDFLPYTDKVIRLESKRLSCKLARVTKHASQRNQPGKKLKRAECQGL